MALYLTHCFQTYGYTPTSDNMIVIHVVYIIKATQFKVQFGYDSDVLHLALKYWFSSQQVIPLLRNCSNDRVVFKQGDVQALSDSLTRGVVVHRGRALEWREAEGSKGPWQTIDSQLALGGRELKNKTSSCVSLVTKQTPQYFLLLLLLHLICKQKVKFFFRRGLTYVSYGLHYCLQ